MVELVSVPTGATRRIELDDNSKSPKQPGKCC
jgi:hypothetical protein